MSRRKIIKGFVLYRLLKRLPFFPFIPLAPGVVLLGSFVNSLRALRRVKRLEQRLELTAA